MKVLLTNDDGIHAEGLQAVRRRLLEVPGVELEVIAPDSNRSAAARAITTRRPLWVEEVDFGDGTVGYATDGTPVDCVRFAALGLVDGFQAELIVSGINHGANLGDGTSGYATDGTPVDCVRFARLGLIDDFEAELVVSGINHGSNLGDDITYSGTVAAALEAIVLGLPGLAVSQQSRARELDFRMGDAFDFEVGARFTARIVEQLEEMPLPERTLLNINVPAGDPTGVEVARLGKRIYRDELALEEEEEGRRRYRIYGDIGYHHEPGTDLAALEEDRIAITPIHFDLTDHAGMDALRRHQLDRLLRPAAHEIGE